MVRMASGSRSAALRRAMLATACGSTLLGPGLARGADGTWTLDNNGAWLTPTNWVDGNVPNGIGEAAFFGPVISSPRLIVVQSTVTVGHVVFESEVPYNVTGNPNVLVLNDPTGATITNLSAVTGHQFSLPLMLASNVNVTTGSAPSLRNPVGVLTFSGRLSGGGNLTKSGSGTLILSNDNSLWTGELIVGGGTVEVLHSFALGTNSGGDSDATTIPPGGTVSLRRNITFNERFRLAGGALNAGTNATIGTPLVLVGGASTLAADSGTSMTVAAGSTGAGDLGTAGSGTVHFNSPLSHAGGLRSGATATVLTVANSFSGAVAAQSGVLYVNQDHGFSSLTLDGGFVQIAPGKLLTLPPGTLDLGSGGISGEIAGPTILRQRSFGETELSDIGSSYDAAITIERGAISAYGSSGLGSSATPTTIASGNAALFVVGQTGDNITLDNATGFAHRGALAGSGTVTGNVALGTAGSILGAVTIRGQVSGGGLTQAQGGTLVLTNANNSYSGATTVGTGDLLSGGGGLTLMLSENGRLLNTSGIVIRRGELLLNNSAGFNLSDRIPDSVPIELRGGRVALRSPSGTVSTEVFGAVSAASGFNTVDVVGSLNIAMFTRQAGATVLFRGTPGGTGSLSSHVLLGNTPTLINGIIGGWATTGDDVVSPDFATYDAQLGVQMLPQAGRPPQVAGASPSDNVFVDQVPAQTLTADTTINSLRLFSLNPNTLDLGGHALNIVSGGIIRNTSDGTYTISNGQVTAGGSAAGGELFFHAHPGQSSQGAGRLRIDAAIVDNPAGAVSLVKSQAGMVILSGANSYTGTTCVNDGILAIETPQAIPQNATLEVDGGEYRIAFSSPATVQFGIVAVKDSGKIQAVSISGSSDTDVTIGAAAFNLEAGILGTKLGGNGPMVKTTLGTVYLYGDNSAYSGAISVNEGSLVAGPGPFGGAGNTNALGTGITTVNGGARLVISHNQPVLGNVVLNGGELAPGGGNVRTFAGTLQLLGNPSILTFDGFDPDDVPDARTLTLSQPVTIPSGVALSVLGPGTFVCPSVLNNGALSCDTAFLDAAGINGPGSIHVLTGTLAAGNLRVESLDLADGTSARIKPNGTSSATSVLRTLSIAGGSTPSATLDLADNALVLDYDVISPLLTTADQIRSGHANGSWTGPGVVSSAASTLSGYGVGYSEAAALSSIPPIFGSVDLTSILVRYTRYGDANLDSVVNLQDFNRLAANFGATDAVWSQGDFNYDMIVNLQDFNRLAGNFGLTAGPDGPTAEDWSALASAIPEPTVFAIVAVPGLAGMLRRRR